jgi:glycosyltransferase involved in cell wall biosynthesis
LNLKISIITATYNSAKTIESTIQSVLSQTYPNIEHIIIDGASKDSTQEIAQNFQNHHPSIRYISELDKGIYDALNKGVQLASGHIIGFLHSDDFFESERVVEEIINSFQSKNYDGVYGDLRYVSSENTTKVFRYWKSRDFDSGLIKNGWMPAHPTLFLKKEVYKKHGLFDLNFKIAADYDFMLRILKDESLAFSYLPLVITNMRVGGASNSFGNLVLKMKEDWKALRKNKIPFRTKTLFLKNVSKIKQFVK